MWLQRSAAPRSCGTSGAYVDSELGCSEVFSAWEESSRCGVPGACCTGQVGPSRSRRFLASSRACRLATACSWLIALGLGARGFGGLRTGACALGAGWRGNSAGGAGTFQLGRAGSRNRRDTGAPSARRAGSGAALRASLAAARLAGLPETGFADFFAAGFFANAFFATAFFAVLRGAVLRTAFFAPALVAALRGATRFVAPAFRAGFFGATTFFLAARLPDADFLPAGLVDLRARLVAIPRSP